MRFNISVDIQSSVFCFTKIEENKNDPKKLWKQLKDLGFKSKTEEASIVLNINNELCHDSKTIADFFNNFFTTVAIQIFL
jgi:hypothetical protein